MLKLKVQYFGHLMRRTDSLGKILMLGKIEGRRRRGRQGIRCLDGITDSMDMSLSKFWSWWWTSLACCSPGGWRVRHDWTTELNWTDWGSSVHGTSQVRILGWVAISFLRGSSWPKNWTWVSCISCTGRQILYHFTSEPPVSGIYYWPGSRTCALYTVRIPPHPHSNYVFLTFLHLPYHYHGTYPPNHLLCLGTVFILGFSLYYPNPMPYIIRCFTITLHLPHAGFKYLLYFHSTGPLGRLFMLLQGFLPHYSMQDLSSSTRDRTCALCSGRVAT